MQLSAYWPISSWLEPGSRAKPEVWTRADAFESVAAELASAPEEVAEAAETADSDAFVIAFERLEAA